MKFLDWFKKKDSIIFEDASDDLQKMGYKLITSKFGPHAGKQVWWKQGFEVIPQGQEAQALAKLKGVPKMIPIVAAANQPAKQMHWGGVGKPKLRVIGLEDTQWGKKLIVTYELSFAASTALRNDLTNQGLWKKAIGYLGKRGDTPIFGITPGQEDKVKDVLAKYLDVSSLEKKPEPVQASEPEPEPEPASEPASEPVPAQPMAEEPIKKVPANKRQFVFEDKGFVEIEDPDAEPDEHGQKPKKRLQRLKIMYVPGQLLDQVEKTLRKDLIYLNFPDSKVEKEVFAKDFHGNERFRIVYYVNGTYDQYVRFGVLLKRFGFNTAEYRKIFEAKFRDPQTGQLPDTIEGRVPPGFIQELEHKLPRSEFHLYDAQKEGVAFLHSRRKAILGDETGLGKTVQLISAAETKMQEDNYEGDCLIIAPRREQLVDQWHEEILRVIGPENEDHISTNPLDPRRYTIVYYSMFSPGQEAAKQNTQKYVQSLVNHNFKIVIFDELHKVKHKDAAKSKYLLEIVKTIPIKWGASATISSNKPMDVKNQLKMLGHPLGDINERKFKEDFAGIKKGRRKTPEQKYRDQVRAAENLNRWLHLTGVYVRRKKSDIKEMPNLDIGSKEGDIDLETYEERFQRRVEKLKAQIPITVLGAARLELAVSKVPITVKRVAELVAEGKRVVVFTAFIESGLLLKYYLSDAIKKINPDWEILTYTSDTKMKDRLEVKPKFIHDQRYRVLLMSVKMGGTGVDFPNAAQNMVINDYDWTPESCEQSEGRIYRINTEQPVNIEYVLAKGTLDELLYEKVQRKRALAAIIQRYRRDFQDELEPKKAAQTLEKIVAAQMEIKHIDDQVDSVAMQQVKGPAHEGLTFKNYLNYFKEDNDLEESVFDENAEDSWADRMRRNNGVYF